MAKRLKLFLVTGLLLSVAAPVPLLGARPPDPYLAYAPYPFPAYYPRPEFLYNSQPYPVYPGPVSSPVPPERRLTEAETSVPVKEETPAPVPSKEAKETAVSATPVNSPINEPRSLEVVPSAPAAKKTPKKRSLRQLTPQQRAVAKMVRPFVHFLRTHRTQSIQQLHLEFKKQFPRETPFFETTFWPIVQANYRPDAVSHLRMERIESQIATQIFKINFNAVPEGLQKTLASPKATPKLVSDGKLTQVLGSLANERDGSHDGSDSLAGLQLRPDFAQKYQLLQALYRAENAIYDHRASPQQALVSLRTYDIRTVDSFKSNSRSTIEYFSTTLRQFRLHQKTILNADFKQLMKSAGFMVKTLRNKLLGPFFVRFIPLYVDLRIHNNNPTHRQRQTLNLAIANLIAEVGTDEYLSTIFRIIRQVPFFAQMKRLPPDQAPPAYPIFRQTLENQLRSGSLRFLLSHFFQSIADKIANIQNLIFMEEPRLLSALRTDFRSLLIDFATRFRLTSFKEFNQALGTVSGQVDTVLRRAPSTPTKSYFSQFISVYAKIAFQIFGRYTFLVKQPEVFAVFAQQHDVPRQFFPWNYQVLVHRIRDPHHLGAAISGLTDAVRPGTPQTDEAVQRIIHELSQYINNPNGIIFSSQAERQRVLDVIDAILRKQNSDVLSHKSMMMVNKLRNEILRNNGQTVPLAQPITVTATPAIDLDAEIARFKKLLQGVHPLPNHGPSEFKVSIRFLEDSAVLTKFLITLFQVSTQDENGMLLAIADTFLDAHPLPNDIRIQMDTFYAAARLYTDHYEALFALNEVPKARLLWKVLMRFYSRECHIELYKQLTLRLVLMAADPQFQEGRFVRVKKILINLFLFLSKNQQFDLQKDCQTASLLITRRKYLSDSVLRRSFLLSSFKKIFFRLSHPPVQPPDEPPLGPPDVPPTGRTSSGHLQMSHRQHGLHSTRKSRYRDFAAQAFPYLPDGGKRVGPPDDEPSDEKKPPVIPPEEKKPPVIPPYEVPKTPPSKSLMILLLQFFLGLYGSETPFNPDFDWDGSFEKLDGGDQDLLIWLLNKYRNDFRKIGIEENPDIILKLRKIILKINPPKPPPPEKPPCPPVESPEPKRPDEQSLTFATSMVDNFFQRFSRHNDVHVSSKRLRFKVSPALYNYFVDLRQKHPEESPASIIKHNPRVYNHIKKSLFFLYDKKQPPKEPPQDPPGPPEETSQPPDEGFLSFSKKYLWRYFRDRLPSYRGNLQLLAKKLFRSKTPELEEYLKSLFLKGPPPRPPNCPPHCPPDKKITEILWHQELRFFNRLIHSFYKSTSYLDRSPDAKKLNARIFFKYVPSTHRQFVHRVFNQFEHPMRFFRAGPVAKMGGLLHRVQFKYKAKCKMACKSTCYRIVDGEQVEITEEEKKSLGFKFDCNAASDPLRMFDLNGNLVPSGEPAQYGCGCDCGAGRGGGVQINSKPTFNLNFNFDNEREALAFQEFLKTSDFLTKIKDSNVIDLEKLKKKYGMSNLHGLYDLQLIHKSFLNAPQTDDELGPSDGSYAAGQPAEVITSTTPNNLGYDEFDDNLQRIQPGHVYTIGGQKHLAGDPEVRLPSMFAISPGGTIEHVRQRSADPDDLVLEEDLPEDNVKTYRQVVLRPSRQGPTVIRQTNDHPIFFPVQDRVYAEQVPEDHRQQAEVLQQTLNNRYYLGNARARGTTPHTLNQRPGLVETYGRKRNIRLI